MRIRTLAFLLIAAWIVLPSLLFADDEADLKGRLQKAAAITALDSPNMKPWHLEMSFEIVDGRGRPTQTGTIEQWWVSPSMSKVIYFTGQLKWVEIVNQEGVFQSKGEEPPELTKLLHRESVHPFPPGLNVNDGTVSLEQKQFGGVALDCITYSNVPDPKAKPVPPAGNPIYCLDRGRISLRITSVHNNTESFARTVVGTYEGKSVAIDQSISVNGIVAAKAHLAS